MVDKLRWKLLLDDYDANSSVAVCGNYFEQR